MRAVLLPADAFAERIVAARKLTSGPLGVNLFVPQPSAGTLATFNAYAAALAAEAEHYGVRLGELRYDEDWAAKLDVVHDLRPEAVSFTFGLPTTGECSRLENAGITTVATVTTVLEAEMALARGAGALVAQGPSAGGHGE
jgi:nitronate monooxygenase